MHTRRSLLVPLAALSLSACDADRLSAPEPLAHDHSAALVVSDRSGAAGLPAADLAAVRAATARYHRLDAALADGFTDIDVFIPGMGHHFLNADRLDATFDASEPELLVYTRDERGRMRLVAVEYAVPTALAGSPPDGFAGDADAWDENTTFALWTLHAWVWLTNPEGVFAPLNARAF